MYTREYNSDQLGLGKITERESWLLPDETSAKVISFRFGIKKKKQQQNFRPSQNSESKAEALHRLLR